MAVVHKEVIEMLLMRIDRVTGFGLWFALCAASSVAAGTTADGACDSSSHARQSACAGESGQCRASDDAQAKSPATPRLPLEVLSTTGIGSVRPIGHHADPHDKGAKETRSACQSTASCDDDKRAVAHLHPPQRPAAVPHVQLPRNGSRSWGVLINDVEVVQSGAASGGSTCTKACAASGACCRANKHQADVADGASDMSSPEADEAAATLLELMQSQGNSVLAGTVFEEDSAASVLKVKGKRRSKRKSINQTVIETIKRIEAEHGSRSSCPACGRSKVTVGGLHHVRRHGKTAEHVEVLRKSAENLDDTASLLERRGLYHQADHCRELAAKLWRDARHSTDGRHSPARFHAMPSAPHTPHSLRSRIERLQVELEGIRQALRRHKGPSHEEAHHPIPVHQH